MASRRDALLKLALVGSVVVTAGIYLVFVPDLIAAGEPGRALAYVLVGWIPYTLAFYALGRLSTSTTDLPSMRPADIGAGLFLVSLLLSLGLDNWGLTPERVPEAHLLQAVGIYVGLALLGWGVGRRSAVIDRLTRDQ